MMQRSVGSNTSVSSCKSALLECFEGRLVARSMAFKIPEPRVLLLFHDWHSADIYMEVESDVLSELYRGNSYRLTNLHVCVCRLKCRRESVTRFVLRPSRRTVCMLIAALPRWFGPSIFTCYQGVVTDVFPPLCMYQLDGTVWLCLVYVWGRLELGPPLIGDTVHLWDAHSVDGFLVLCERSNITITQQVCGRSGTTTRPLQWLCENLQLSFKDVLWLNKQYRVLEDKFRRLLSVLPAEDKAIVIDVLLVNMVRKMQPQVNAHMLTLRAVFLNHDEQCCITREGVLGGDVRTVAQLAAAMTLNADCEDWKHRRTQYGLLPREIPFMCHLSTSCGRVVASDDTGSLPVLLTGDHCGCLPAVIGFIVVIPIFVRVVEVFRGGKQLKYLQVCVEDMLGMLDVRGCVPVVGALCPDCRHITALHHTCPSPRYTMLRFQLLHKTTPIVESVLDRPYCHLMGYLYDDTCQVVSSSPAMVCLTLVDDLVPLQLVLGLGGRYQLRLPPTTKLMKHRAYPCQHHAPQGDVVDVVDAFRVPQDVSLKLESIEVPSWQKVKESLQDCSTDQLKTHSVKGVIVTRRHQTPRFPSEKVAIGVDGYGIPGPRVMILTLRDDGGRPDQEMSIFLKNWKLLRYPLGMVPGATVVCHRIHKKMAEGGRPYFINDKFTWLGLEAFKL